MCDAAAGSSLPELQGARLLGARGLREQRARSMVVERRWVQMVDALGLSGQRASVRVGERRQTVRLCGRVRCMDVAW